MSTVATLSGWPLSSLKVKTGAESLIKHSVPKANGDTSRISASPSVRHSCSICSNLCFTVMPDAGMVFIPVIAFTEGDCFGNASSNALPDALRPTVHYYYRSRVLDVVDELPKYLDLPVAWRGSGELYSADTKDV